MIGLLMNDESERTWKEAVVAAFAVMRKTTKNLNHAPPGRDLNPGPLEYEAEVVITRSRLRFEPGLRSMISPLKNIW
jgi:hypothetical protein